MGSKIRFLLNDRSVETERPAGELLLDWLRASAGQKDVKQGCREGDCGACAVMIGELDEGALRYRAVPSCMVLLGQVAGRHVVSVAGLGPEDGLSPVQRTVAEEGGTQCGFCTPGVVVSLTSGLCTAPSAGEAGACEAHLSEMVGGNICRCTGYASFRRAVARLAEDFARRDADPLERLHALVDARVLPPYFARIPERLGQLEASAPGAPSPEAADYALAGGTDALVPRRTASAIEAPYFYERGAEFEALQLDRDQLRIDATATFAELERAPLWHAIDPRAERHLALFASPLVRERATIGGNVANASPIADGVSWLLALDAELELAGPGGARRLPLAQFFLGYRRTALEPGERIRAARVAVGRRLRNFEKVSRRERLDIATVNSAACFEVTDGRFAGVRISAGGVGPTPMLLLETSARLEGAAATPASVRAALDVARREVQPISDVRGTADYKRLLLGQLVLAHFVEAQLAGELPQGGFEELCR